ncbi:MAG: SusC/RagA family TonB-linked outer membrane protein [Prevotellaceae bacterium]|jgi:TonB-linked SusC/RagA family outer membrane protein|nr:SusC/RagA family TonB-linked outer membrane protein [Prevotellaceae bacterium]
MRKIKVFLVCMVFAGTSVLSAQSVQVSGVVTDAADGQPLPGVSVVVKDSNVAVMADINGRYTIPVPENATLVYSFLGMKRHEEVVKGRTVINVAMVSDAVALDEVVVTGFGQVDKRLFTGATDKLTAEHVKLDGLPDISRALEGRSAGVSVQNVSGTFGTAPKIRVRGATSIYGSSKPLWVVDGVVLEDVVEVDADGLSSGDATTLISSAIAGLNADDIESFQILKDGSATSIYGARAMAGVIVVTTKKGKAGTSSINYTGEFTTRLIPRYSEFNIMNSQEQMGVYQELQQKGWLNYAETFRARNSGVYGKMYELMNTYNHKTGTYMLPNTPEARNAYLRQAEMRNTDWFDELFNANIMQNHAVSMSGGTEKSTYYASLSAMVDPGWTKSSSVNRYTSIINASHNVLKNLTVNFSASGSYRKQKAPGTLAQEMDVVSGEVKREFDINPYSYALNTSRTLDSDEFYTRNYAPFNIKHELENNYIDLNVVDLKFQGEVKWKILPELEVAALGAVKYSSSSMEHHIKDESNQALAYRSMADATIRENNPYLYSDPEHPYDYPITILPVGGIYNRTDNKMLGYDFRSTLNWNKVFNDIHITNFMGGMEINSVDRGQNWFRGWGRQYTMGDIPFYAYQVFKRGQEENSDYFTINNTRSRNVAFFATGIYSYEGKYTINGTVRYEGSNKFGKSRSARWLPTWNISGAWNAHEESFFEVVKPVLSHFTLKASYSLTADAGPSFVTNSSVVIKSQNVWRPDAASQESALAIAGLENSELTYEKKHELNIGADMGFFDNRFNLTVDWYTRNNFDLIGPIAVMGIGGQIDKYANVAEMKSHGIEFTLSTKNIVGPKFQWTTDVTFSYNKTEITKLDSRMRVFDLITGNGFGREGYSYRTLFSVPFRGLTRDGIPTFLDQDGEVTSTGIYFQERNNVDFLTYEGPAEPTIGGGLGNVFSYRNFKLNVFITYSFGNKIRLDPAFHSSYSDLDAMPKEFANRWVLSGDEKHTNVPVIVDNRTMRGDYELAYAYSAYNYSDVRIADGGFIRMKEISLSYDFPKNWINPLKLNNLSLKLQATNLFLLYADSKLNGQDPEFFRSGGVSAPVPKQFTFTVRVGL